jgi:hypothetical protein
MCVNASKHFMLTLKCFFSLNLLLIMVELVFAINCDVQTTRRIGDEGVMHLVNTAFVTRNSDSCLQISQ